MTTVPVLCSLLLAAVLSTGCDPLTESRITNSTTGAIDVALVLDSAKCGTDGYAQGLLQEFGSGEGIEILAIDTTQLTGRYRLAGAGSMIVHQALGKEPFWCFGELRVTKDDYTAAFRGDQAITQQFVRGEDYQYRFDLTDAFFAEAAASFNAGSEHVGRLRLGLSDDDVRAIVPGEPEKGETVLWGATDEYGQEWRYPAEGIRLDMMSTSADGARVIGAITVTAPSTWETQRGIGIGSSQDDVLRVYGAFRAEDAEGMGVSGESFVAGSIYGGMIFIFAEGKVNEIFLGAAGE